MDPLPVRDPTLWVVAFEVDDVFGYSKGKIDVYAKPMTTGVSWPVETHEKRPSRIKKKSHLRYMGRGVGMGEYG